MSPRRDNLLRNFSVSAHSGGAGCCRPYVDLVDAEDIRNSRFEAHPPGDHSLVRPAPHRLRVYLHSLGQPIGRNTGLGHRLA